MKQADQRRFIIKRFVVGPMGVNCYVVADAATQEACLIDPGGDPGIIKNFLKKNGYTLKFIIITHGHGDHIAANGAFEVPIFIHSLDRDFLMDPSKNLSSMFIFHVTSPKASRLLEHGDRIELGGIHMDVIHTPGHTPGSISLGLEGIIFTGDTLFCGGIGRTDFPYGDGGLIIKSIKEKLLVFSDDTVIYPGHGGESTIGEEKRTNPFLS